MFFGITQTENIKYAFIERNTRNFETVKLSAPF